MEICELGAKLYSRSVTRGLGEVIPCGNCSTVAFSLYCYINGRVIASAGQIVAQKPLSTSLERGERLHITRNEYVGLTGFLQARFKRRTDTVPAFWLIGKDSNVNRITRDPVIARPVTRARSLQENDCRESV